MITVVSCFRGKEVRMSQVSSWVVGLALIFLGAGVGQFSTERARL
jgi:hypothetical protein